MAIKTGQGRDKTICFFSEASDDIDALVFSTDKVLNYQQIGNHVYGNFSLEFELNQDNEDLNTFIENYASSIVEPVTDVLIDGTEESISSPSPSAIQVYTVSKGADVQGKAEVTALYSQISIEYLQSASGSSNKVKITATGVDAGTTKTLTATTINAQYSDITLSDGDLTIGEGKKGDRTFTTVS